MFKYAARVWTTTPASSQPADTCLPTALPPAISPLSLRPPTCSLAVRAAGRASLGGLLLQPPRMLLPTPSGLQSHLGWASSPAIEYALFPQEVRLENKNKP